MESFLPRFADLLMESGPAVTFLLAFLETSWLQGFFMPTGPVMIFSAALLSEAGDPWWPILVAGLLGGALGDSVHFWIGRRLGERAHQAPGRLGRMANRHMARTTAMFKRHPAFAVTLARLVSFVRTLMPGVAGASGLSYRRFLPFDLLGVLGWGVSYVAIGVLAGENWSRVSSLVGTGWLLVFVALGIYFWRRMRRGSPVQC